MKSDKSNGIVVVNKDDYLSKMHEILADTTKFKPLSSDLFKHDIKTRRINFEDFSVTSRRTMLYPKKRMNI